MNNSYPARVVLYGKLKPFSPTGPLQVLVSGDMTPRELRATVSVALSVAPGFRGPDELVDCAVANEDRVLAEGERLGNGREFSLLPPVCGG